jgi:actin-related protein
VGGNTHSQREKRQQRSREAEKQRSREAEKQRSREAEKQRSREAEKHSRERDISYFDFRRPEAVVKATRILAFILHIITYSMLWLWSIEAKAVYFFL